MVLSNTRNRMKGMMLKTGTSLLLALLLGNAAMAERMRTPSSGSATQGNGTTSRPSGIGSRAGDCSPATHGERLEFNNVSALIEQGGSMWQNRANNIAAYEVPKGSRLNVLYAGALWMGGRDFSGQLRVAAITFRTQNDFWPGPLLTDGSAETNQATCLKYDTFFKTTRAEVARFVAYRKCLADPVNCDVNESFPGYQIPLSIRNWPGNNYDAGYDFQLAPFYDEDGDGVYDPEQGDYPWYDIEKDLECGNDRRVTLYGDQNFWWVFNDNGNIHTETGADPIGMEIKAQAFAFSTNDEVNDMTFYNYELINRGSYRLTNTYFGQWADPDVGFAEDDFVGCDVSRGLGYAYNGRPFDPAGNGQAGYGFNPPAVGIDFFEGPYQDSDGIDNPLTTNIINAQDSLGIPYRGIGIGYGDGVVDNERFGMRKFLYYFRSDQTAILAQREPQNGTDYYRYLQGIWLDGTPFYYGGTAYFTHPNVVANGMIECDYMFPGTTDPLNWGTRGVAVPTSNWTEAGEGNTPADRRFMQSAGPFTLEPGQRNNITVGVVYARAASGNTFASVEKLQIADDKAQALFDNCFKILDGPPAPELTFQELDREIILYLSNPPSSTNSDENYVERDPFIILPPSMDSLITDNDVRDSLSSYRFQGYKIYQLKDATVSSSNLSDGDQARLIAQCDIKDGVTRLINFIKDEDLGFDVPTLMVDGEDKGLRHSFRVTTDAFTQARLINHKTYYYMAVAYAYNNYKNFNPNDPTALDGQKKVYIESRQSYDGSPIKSYSTIPHIPVPEANGTRINSQYGDGPEITRIEGTGNGGMFIDLTDASEAYILSNNIMANPTYKKGRGPVNVKVIDPLNVVPGRFEIRFDDGGGNIDNAKWTLYAAEAMTVNGRVYAAGDVITRADRSISVVNEQLVPDLGISIGIDQIFYQLRSSRRYTNLIRAEVVYTDSSKRWLGGVRDGEGTAYNNWIRSGTQQQDCDAANYPDPNTDPCIYNDYLGYDDQQIYEGILEGTWAPYALCATGATTNEYPLAAPISSYYSGNVGTLGAVQLAEIPSVDIVFTSDKSKWTRSPVLEMQEDRALAQGGAYKNELRQAPSVDKNGNPDGTGTGMGWFPGYAIDVETGERLNIAFGEDSWLASNNGRDMLFNPTSTLFSPAGLPIFGGKHYVYVFKNQRRDFLGSNQRMPAYDEGAFLYSMLSATPTPGTTAKRIMWRSCVWVGMPMLEPNYSFNNPSRIPTTTRVKIRVEKRYEQYSTDPAVYLPSTAGAVNGYRPMYRFSMNDLAVETNYDTYHDSILSLINVVPNPYYAQNSYEVSRIDTRVKITNLPEICTIKIFNVAGQMVRYFTKDSPITSLDWDLKNQAGVPIAGGVYIIHVNVPGVGEKVVKWFGAMRASDLEAF